MNITTPRVATLVAAHGNTAAGRAAARAELVATVVAEAGRRAARVGLTISCRSGRCRTVRFGHPAGCRDDGTGCLCVCHDGQDQT